MYRRSILATAAVLLGALLLSATGASAKPASIAKLCAQIKGPGLMTAGVATKYNVLLSNCGTAAFQRVRVGFTDLRLLKHSSVPYKKSYGDLYTGGRTANWTLRNFKPSARYKLVLTLVFPAVPGAHAYGFSLDAFGTGPAARLHKDRSPFYRTTG